MNFIKMFLKILIALFIGSIPFILIFKYPYLIERFDDSFIFFVMFSCAGIMFLYITWFVMPGNYKKPTKWELEYRASSNFWEFRKNRLGRKD